VETGADLVWSLMALEMVEDLQLDRGWTVAEHAERLALVLRRTLLHDPEQP
jgi:hypothetical protein